MRFLAFIFLLFSSCSKKFIQETKKDTIIDSNTTDYNVLSIVNDAQNYDYIGPWIWFGMIIGLVMLLSFASLIFKK